MTPSSTLQSIPRWRSLAFLAVLFGVVAPTFAFQVSYATKPVTSATATATVRQSTLLFAAKKKSPAASKRVQVKMLKAVPGTGQKGDVVLVTPAFFNNKLRPTQSAEVISDEDVQKENLERDAEAAAAKAEAMALQEELQAEPLTMKRKAGPDGQLFGGIGAKVIMEELVSQFSSHEEYLGRKNVKVVAFTDENDKKIRGDIKHTGDFGIQISLSKDIKANLKISVVPEEE